MERGTQKTVITKRGELSQEEGKSEGEEEWQASKNGVGGINRYRK